jgi:hypothetical protein
MGKPGRPPMSEMTPLRRRMIEDMTGRNLSPGGDRPVRNPV